MASLSPERKAALAREKAKHNSGNAFFKMTSDTAKIRLLPLAADEEVGVKITQHFIANRGYTCPMGTHGRPGVIDTAINELRKLGDAEAAELADGLESNRNTKYALKIIERSNPTQVCIFRAPYSVYNTIFKAFEADGDDLADPKDGCDVRVSKEGTGMGTKYDTRILKPTPLIADADGNPDNKAIKALLAESAKIRTSDLARTDEQGAFDALADSLPSHIWKQIRKKVSAVLTKESEESEGSEEDGEEEEEKPKTKKKAAAPADDEDDDEEEEKPKTKPKGKAKAAPAEEDDDEEDDEEEQKPKAKAKGKAAADDEDDDDDEEDDGDEDEDPPARSPKAKGKASAADDEDDDADEEDDEEEEKPKAKAKAKAAPADDEDDDADDEGDDEEEEKPKAKPKGKAAPAPADDEDDDEEEEKPKAKTKVNKFKAK